jgi:hypothetical protein
VLLLLLALVRKALGFNHRNIGQNTHVMIDMLKEIFRFHTFAATKCILRHALKFIAHLRSVLLLPRNVMLIGLTIAAMVTTAIIIVTPRAAAAMAMLHATATRFAVIIVTTMIIVADHISALALLFFTRTH